MAYIKGKTYNRLNIDAGAHTDGSNADNMANDLTR